MLPESLLKISSALGVSADYLLTGDIIDKDLLILSNKLRRLTPSQVRTIEAIIDECATLLFLIASKNIPDAPFDSCFFILNGNLNPTPKDHCATFLINADVIDQTSPQFFPELRLFSGQILQLGDEVREYLLRIILLLDELRKVLCDHPQFLLQPFLF